MAGNPYIRSRKLSDEGVRALATPDFRVISLNAPFVLGAVPGLVTMFKAYTDYALGKFAPMPEFAPPAASTSSPPRRFPKPSRERSPGARAAAPT